MKKGLCIELTQGQYDHLYNIMCSQDEIVEYLNESDDLICIIKNSFVIL